MYNYYEAIKEDVKNYIENEIDFNEWKGNKDGLEEKLNNNLWIVDSVTGNGSGSYTFNRAKAEEMVKDNLKLCIEALEEFGTSAKEFGEKVFNDEWEWLDVSIRCYLLGQAIAEALEDYEEELEEEEESEEE